MYCFGSNIDIFIFSNHLSMLNNSYKSEYQFIYRGSSCWWTHGTTPGHPQFILFSPRNYSVWHHLYASLCFIRLISLNSVYHICAPASPFKFHQNADQCNSLNLLSTKFSCFATGCGVMAQGCLTSATLLKTILSHFDSPLMLINCLFHKHFYWWEFDLYIIP